MIVETMFSRVIPSFKKKKTEQQQQEQILYLNYLLKSGTWESYNW